MLLNVNNHNKQQTSFGDATRIAIRKGVARPRQVDVGYEQRLLKEFLAQPKTKQVEPDPNKPKVFTVHNRYELSLHHTETGDEIVQENKSKTEKTIFSVNEGTPTITKILHSKLVELLETL